MATTVIDGGDKMDGTEPVSESCEQISMCQDNTMASTEPGLQPSESNGAVDALAKDCELPKVDNEASEREIAKDDTDSVMVQETETKSLPEVATSPENENAPKDVPVSAENRDVVAPDRLVVVGETGQPVAYRDVGSGDKASSEASVSSDSDDSGDDEKEKEVTMTVDKEEEEDETKGKKGANDEMKTRGEIYPEDLPPLEDLKVTVDESVVMEAVGTISGIVGVLAIVQANKGIPALDVDSILFLEGRRIFGQVFETFGPVASPLYSVRFNSTQSMEGAGIKLGLAVYWAPNNLEYSHFVFMEQVMRMKGSDASWEHNNEPPDKFIEYSDDESERRAKAKMRGKVVKEDGDGGDGNEEQTSFRKRKQKKDRPIIQQPSSANADKNGKMEVRLDSWPPRFPGPRQHWTPPPPPRQHYRTMSPQPPQMVSWQQSAVSRSSPWQQQAVSPSNPWMRPNSGGGMIALDTSRPPPRFQNMMPPPQRPFTPPPVAGLPPHVTSPSMVATPTQDMRSGIVQLPPQFGEHMPMSPVFGSNPQMPYMPMYGGGVMPPTGHTFGAVNPVAQLGQQASFQGQTIGPYVPQMYGQPPGMRPPIR